MSRVITVLGGNGFIGSRTIKFLLDNVKDIKIYSVSRSGKETSSDSRVHIVKGDCLNPSTFADVIHESTGIVHSIGVLFTTKDEEYQLKNKESCLRVAKIANENKQKTNFVYVSASRGIPFPLSLKFSGYIKAKRECEQELLTSFNNLNPFILRPGFVRSDDKPITKPIYQCVNAVDVVSRKLLSPSLIEKLELPSKGIEINSLVKFIAGGALGKLTDGQIYSNDYMNTKENEEKINLI